MAVRKISIDDSEISVIFGLHDEDYICLTDMVKAGDNSDRTNIVIQNWMRRKDTISYLGVWENLHNPDFKSIEFDAIKNASGTNRFILTAKMENLNAVFIHEGMPQGERLQKLNQIAIQQMTVLENVESKHILKG